MKKLLLTSLFAFLFLFSSHKTINAQTWSNTFNCTYNFADERCEVATQNFPLGCGPGTEVTESVCTEISDENDCLEKVNNDCRVIDEEGQRWTCIGALGGCQPTGGEGEYADLDSCQAGCSGPVTQSVYKCESTGDGCVLCGEDEIGENPECALSYSECVDSCTESQSFYSCRAYDKSCIKCANEDDDGCMPLSQCTTNCKPIGQVFEVICTENFGRGIDTAIGCIPLEVSSIISFILLAVFGIGGGIAFLLIVFAGFQIITSQGDPRRLQGGKELMVAAIGGVIMLIFSVFMLRVLGVNILGIF